MPNEEIKQRLIIDNSEIYEEEVSLVSKGGLNTSAAHGINQSLISNNQPGRKQSIVLVLKDGKYTSDQDNSRFSIT